MSNATLESEFTADNTGVTCFTQGTMIRTPRGDVLIETLRVGDLVLTADNGPQKIRWIGRRVLNAAQLRADASLRPVLIKADVLGNSRPLLVSQQHGMMIGHNDLVRAKHLALHTPGARIAHGKTNVTYIHLMFDAHQIIFANNAPSESFYPGPIALQMMNAQTCAELFAIFPDLRQIAAMRQNPSPIYGQTARPFLARKAVRKTFAFA